MDVKLSLLDRTRTRTGEPESEALRHTVERAAHAESLGYHRFWVAEHHAVPGVASGAPAVLLAAIGAHTRSIRLGSGGVMLPHHQPLVVAEQFLMLEGLYPHRVDVGIGRTLGFTEPVRRALRQDSDDRETYEQDVTELRTYLEGTAPITAQPVTQQIPQMFLLATGSGLASAARLGLPVVIGGPVLNDPKLPDIVSAYRKEFQPSSTTEHPYVVISTDVYIAETSAAARQLALPEIWAMARSRETGAFGPLEPVQDIHSQRWSDLTKRRVDESLQRAIAGTSDEVANRLENLVETTAAQELLVSTSTYDHEALAALDSELASLAGQAASGIPAPPCKWMR